ncbi:MAG: hypothetical protein J6Y37_11455 [Paludibacteraceae bacterium]|nr:hypothetical protein [Paludibacteraceae bacterium]
MGVVFPTPNETHRSFLFGPNFTEDEVANMSLETAESLSKHLPDEVIDLCMEGTPETVRLSNNIIRRTF